MQITVFGASGKVGRLVVAQALADNYKVVAFAHHNPGFEVHPNLRVVQGDIHDRKAVSAAIKGSTLVISALGSWGGKQKDIVSAGIKNIIPVMEAHNISRIITLTGADARASGDYLGPLHRLSHLFIKLSPVKSILHDGEQHIKLLEASGLDWTAVRSPAMNNRGRAVSFKLGNTRPKPWTTINRQSVALAIVSLIKETQYSRQAIFISRSS